MIWKLLKRSTITESGTTPAIVFNPEDPAFVDDPYSCFAWLRRHDPVHMSEQGAWLLSRHADVVAALADRRFSNEPAFYAVLHRRNRDKYISADVANNTLPFLEGDSHKRLRHLIAPAFLNFVRGGAMDLEGLASDVLAAREASRALDLLHDFATPLALKVLCRILGFNEADGQQLKAWSDAFFYLFAPMPSTEVRDHTDQTLTAFRRYVSAVVESRQAKRGTDLISVLLDKRDEGAVFSNSELVDNCMLLFADGIGNVDAGMANLFALLLQNRDQLERLYSNPALIPAAVDEALRLETPGQFIARVATEDMQLHGKLIKQHQAVFLLLASANRDEQIFSDPDAFQPERSNSREALSFGKGAHTCVGAHLVRLEMQAALTVLLQSCRHIRMSEDHLRWRPRRAHRWLQALPVSLSPLP